MLRLLPQNIVSKQIEYKAGEYGIKKIFVDEGYALGVDSLKEVAVNKKNYTPKERKNRGLFKSVIGLINVDVNGARKILKKYKKNFYDLITGIKQVKRIFEKLKSSLKSVKIYGQIDVERFGDHLDKAIKK